MTSFVSLRAGLLHASFAVICSVLCSSQVPAFAQDSVVALDARYPDGPRAEMTPGSLCDHPDSRRYPEGIAYCSRDVDSGLKRQIIRDYDARFGYRIGSMSRGEFKIDHYIPLCAGGSNEKNNLWPQHRTVYVQTDQLEQVLCEKMAAGRLQQHDAVDLVREAKNDLSKVRAILAHVRSL